MHGYPNSSDRPFRNATTPDDHSGSSHKVKVPGGDGPAKGGEETALSKATNEDMLATQTTLALQHLRKIEQAIMLKPRQ